jgi:hypothetical protein
MAMMVIKQTIMANEETRPTNTYCKLSALFAKSGIKKIVAVPGGTATIFKGQND